MRKKRATRRNRAPQARIGSRTIQANGPAPDLLRKIDAYWRAANYLSVGQIYLFDNPLLKKPLKRDHVKPRLLGHRGTTPSLNFIYTHLNRVIKERDLSVIFLAGPGHGGPGIVANTWLEGTYSEVYPKFPRTKKGCRSYSSNSRFRAAFQVTSHLKLLAGCARGHQPLLYRGDSARRRPPRPRRPRHGSVIGTPVPGLAGRLSAHGTPRLFQLLRSVRSHHRLGVQSAREVAEGMPPHPVAPAGRLAQLPAELSRLATGPQWIQPSGPRVH